MIRIKLSVGVMTLIALAAVGLGQQASTAASAKAGHPHEAATIGNTAFEKLKSLGGEWEAKLPDGRVAYNKVEVIANGSAIIIREGMDKEDMLTVVYPDGNQLMATHFCAAKNQPRFVASSSSDASVVAFKLRDITNVSSPDTGHMDAVVFRVLDANHHVQEWTWVEKGQARTERFEFARKM